MPDIVNVSYAQTGQSTASGKSRALMFLGLDKLFNQGVKKVIVAVPERSIGASFDRTDLTTYGFFADWNFNPDYNLCTPGGESSKVTAFKNFLSDSGPWIWLKRVLIGRSVNTRSPLGIAAR